MKKILLTSGGTGGHMFPILRLHEKLQSKKENYEIKIITDERVKKYINLDNIKIIKSDSPFRKKGIFHLLKSFFFILISTVYCLFFLVIFRPNIILGAGGYVSFPVLIASLILRKKFILYETNAVLGRVNKFFLPFCEKLFSGYQQIKFFPKKHNNKFLYAGQLIRSEFSNFSINYNFYKNQNFNKENNFLRILILGGSQGAKVFSENFPICFQTLIDKNIKLSIKQQVHNNQNFLMKKFNSFDKEKFNIELFEFEKNIAKFIQEADIVICRSGSSTLAELAFLNKPFIAVPFPYSLDNHQYFNAMYYFEKNCCWVLDEKSKDFNDDIVNILEDIYISNNLLEIKSTNLLKLKKSKYTEDFVTKLFKHGTAD